MGFRAELGHKSQTQELRDPESFSHARCHLPCAETAHVLELFLLKKDTVAPGTDTTTVSLHLMRAASGMAKPFLLNSRWKRWKVCFLKHWSELSHCQSSKVKIFHIICITDFQSAFFCTGPKEITLNKLTTESKMMHPGQGYKDSTAARQVVGRNAA